MTLLKPRFTILSFDYLDLDVYINVRMFYRLAGYVLTNQISKSSLVVILRGLPPHPYLDYQQTVHVYDYVKEMHVDYRHFFPSAYIYYISVASPSSDSGYDSYISRYLPVFPSIWSPKKIASRSKNVVPVHIGNFKPIASPDHFQSQLIKLALSNRIKIYGGKWSKVNVPSRPLSYFSANRVLSRSSFCLGLMYPYQRGHSLSGRMWQAPLNGCFVISEPGTNIFNCPGILEVSDYSQDFSYLQSYSTKLTIDANSFWNQQTVELAADLNLTLDYNKIVLETNRGILTLYIHHLNFLWHHQIVAKYRLQKSLLRSTFAAIYHSLF